MLQTLQWVLIINVLMCRFVLTLNGWLMESMIGLLIAVNVKPCLMRGLVPKQLGWVVCVCGLSSCLLSQKFIWYISNDPFLSVPLILDVIHTNCLVSHIKSFPPHTAPAGYVCPACSTSVSLDFTSWLLYYMDYLCLTWLTYLLFVYICI